MPSFKPQFTQDVSEFDTAGVEHERSARTTRMAESIRLGLTVLALLAGITIVGTSGDTLRVYNATHLGQDFLLPLWPNEFDIRPTIALVTCGSIIFLASIVSLTVSKVPSVRNHTLIHNSISFLAPIVCLIAALIGTSFFYGVNASNTVSSLHSWSCQWSSISMNVQPYWGPMCKESKAALYLTVMIIPLEVLVFSAAAWGSFVQKKQFFVHERKGSPAMS